MVLFNRFTASHYMKRKNQRSNNDSSFNNLCKLTRYIEHQHRNRLVLLLVLILVSSFGEMISLGSVLPFLGALGNAEKLLENPQLQPFLTACQIETSSELIVTLALLFITAVVVANGLRILTINFQIRLATDISSHLSCQLYNRTILQPYSFHTNNNSSDLISLITEDTRVLTTTILIPLVGIMSSGFVTLALAITLFLINWYIALVTTAVLGGAYFYLYRLRKNLLRTNSKRMVQGKQQQIKVVQEGLGGVRDVLLGDAQNYFKSAYQQTDGPYRKAIASITIISQTPRYMIEPLALVSIILLALTMGQNGDFTQAFPVLGSLALGANRLLPSVQQIFRGIAVIQGSQSSLKRIIQGLERPVDTLQSWIPSEKLSLDKEIRFQHIWFRYSNETDWILRDLNFTIKAKTTVGVIGSTGSGKSTTVDIILGLLQPQKGLISVDEYALEGKSLRKWQQSIAHVPQNIFLADATIAENIAFGISKNHINYEQVYETARLAQVDEFIQTLPAQYETYIGERGVRLSGGQRQRIGIARALYKQASVIIFDEATSALDNSTEKEVMKAINNLSHKFTIILIAHRLSTLESCDNILELSQGQVVAEGTYQELLSDSSNFHRGVFTSS